MIASITSGAMGAVTGPGLHVDVASAPVNVTPPSWTQAMNEPAASLKSTVTGATFLGSSSGLSGAWAGNPASAGNSFPAQFTPGPTYWITFGNFQAGHTINLPIGNYNVILPPELKV